MIYLIIKVQIKEKIFQLEEKEESVLINQEKEKLQLEIKTKMILAMMILMIIKMIIFQWLEIKKEVLVPINQVVEK